MKEYVYPVLLLLAPVNLVNKREPSVYRFLRLLLWPSGHNVVMSASPTTSRSRSDLIASTE